MHRRAGAGIVRFTIALSGVVEILSSYVHPLPAQAFSFAINGGGLNINGTPSRQQHQKSQPTAPPRANSDDPSQPEGGLMMAVCVRSAAQAFADCKDKDIGVWRITNSRGIGAWADGEYADIDVQQFDQDGIVAIIRNRDTSTNPGATWKYTGQFSAGGLLQGDATASYQGQAKSFVWSGRIPKPQDQKLLSQRLDQIVALQNRSEQAAQRRADGAALVLIGALGLAVILGTMSPANHNAVPHDNPTPNLECRTYGPWNDAYQVCPH